MHRELRSIDRPFAMESQGVLYLFTLFIGICVGLDLWPVLGNWLNQTFSLSLPVGSDSINLAGFRLRWAMLAALVGGMRALYTSLDSLLHGRLGADLALALAVLAALLLNQPLVAAEVIFIGLVGECLEAYTFGQTQHAIRLLADTFPKMCLVYKDGEQVMTPLDEVQVGERVAILPGKRVPVDGIIIEGRSSLDQSNLTGESLPLEKGPGDEVLAGTVNQFGALTVEVKRVSQNTVMGQVIETTARALKAKSQGERTADRLARYFLPVVLTIAVITFLVQWWILRGSGAAIYLAAAPALAVLVVACPCALILATPATTMAALARLARTGVLVKRGIALERLASVKRFVFDKTGTLTTAQLSVGNIIPIAPDLSESDLLRWAASAEKKSEHPIAQAILRVAQERNLELWPVENFEAKPGAGLIAQCQGTQLLAGNERFLHEQGVVWSDEASNSIASLDSKGQTTLLIGREGKLLGIIGVWDTIRPESAAIIQQLQELGVSVSLLSGDRTSLVKQVGEQLGIADVAGDCLPNDKATRIQNWKKSEPVAMVGDGVNDSPGLAQADVGLAVSQASDSTRVGSDIAAEASDIVLMGDPLQSLPLLVRLSREMVVILRQNILWFAFGVNVIGIALVAWLLPAWSPEGRQQSPLWAAFYHQIGSLLVLLNSMRLLWFAKEKSLFWSRLGTASQNLDRWIEQFNLHDLSHWLIQHSRKVAVGLLATILIAYAATSITIVPSDSIGMVQRCGRVLDEPLPPGLHIQLPWPWDQVTLLQPDRIRRVEVGFRRVGMVSDAQTWASSHADNLLTDPDEALLMTADGNLVEVQATVLYQIANPKQFMLGAVDLDNFLRAQTEGTLRELAAQRRFDDLLATDKNVLQQTALTGLQQRLRRSASHLGVHITTLALEDLHPPQKVVKDYYEVTRALAARSRLVTEARIDQEKNLSRETVNATRILAEAAGDASAKMVKAQAERDAFFMLEVTQRGKLWMLASSLANPAWPVAALAPLWSSPSDPELHRRLTEYRLVVESAELMLNQRPKILRDPRIKGTLQLIPESLKLRLPALGERPAPNPEMP